MSGKTPKQKLSEKLRELRESHGVTQTFVADVIDIKQQAYSQYETGKRIPSAFVLYKIASFYGIPADDLLKLCIDLDPSLYYDAVKPTKKGQETADYLAFIKQEKFAKLTSTEKRLLYYYAKLNKIDKAEIMDYLVFKVSRKTI